MKKHLLLLYALSLFFVPACGQSSNSAQKAITLEIGEGIQFRTGKVTRLESEGDMVIRYLPPQSPHGWRYNPCYRLD